MQKTKIVIGYLILTGFYQLPEYIRNETGSISAFLGLMALFMVIAWLILRWQGQHGFAAIGMAGNRSAAGQLCIGLALQGFISLGAFGISCLTGITQIIHVPPAEDFLMQGLLFTVGTFLPSLAEDVLTRGYVFLHSGKQIKPVWFVTLSTALYVLNHIYRLTNGPVTWVLLIVLGISLAIPLVITRSLWLTLGLHWSNNIIYRLTNDVMTTEDVTGFSSTWILIAGIGLLIPVLPLIINRFGLKSEPILYNGTTQKG